MKRYFDIILTSLVAVAFLGITCLFGAEKANAAKEHVGYFFYTSTCQLCTESKAYLEDLNNNSVFDSVIYTDITTEEGKNTATEYAEKCGIDISNVSSFFYYDNACYIDLDSIKKLVNSLNTTATVTPTPTQTPTTTVAQKTSDNTSNSNVTSQPLSAADILFLIVGPGVFLVIGYLLIKKLKL